MKIKTNSDRIEENPCSKPPTFFIHSLAAREEYEYGSYPSLRWISIYRPVNQLACFDSDYKPLTGQLVCPAHPMQKPHLRDGLMFVSASTASLSNPASSNNDVVAPAPPRGTTAAKMV
mmetsp:Transcript_62422/g.151953  ORF Transcript_62422/g.151953 Transcript_62422/m.151953 type:complete len:118 (+) Transcript_62422:909-1262(+)